MNGFRISRSLSGGVRLSKDGSAATPIITWIGDPNTGIYRVSADALALAVGGTTAISMTTSQINLNKNVVIANGAGTELLFSGDLQTDIKSDDSIIIDFDRDADGGGSKVFEVRAGGVTKLKIHDSLNVIQQGGDSDTPASYQFKAADALTNAVGSSLNFKPGQSAGTDKAGADMTVAGGQCTGSGTEGAVIFSTAAAGGSGTTVRSLVERARITSAGLTIAEGLAIVAGTVTGLKIGTTSSQKIGLFGKTPVVQSAAYTVSNPSTSRTLDVSAATLAELRAFVGTLADDLKLLGAVG